MTGALLGLLPGGPGLWVALAGLVAVVAAYIGLIRGRATRANRRADEAEARAATAESYRATRERMDDATPAADGDAAAARDRLRARGRR